ncbi:MAG: dephospho-CoA kinase [Gemmataceae bacterium]|nr:dephospho-CoA kinase [Gemmataceae bacterium]
MASKSNKPVLGLIGGIGSGKSHVAAEFAKHGGHLISGDQLGHEALRQPDIKEQVVRRWGREVLDDNGEIVRRRVGAKVFANPAERHALEAMVFPFIEDGIRKQIESAQADAQVAFVILDAAIMLETGWNKVCDSLVYVHAPHEIRLQRLAEKRGWSAKEVEGRENAQLSLNDKRHHADFVIDNSGAPEAVAPQVEGLLEKLGIPHRQKSEEFR